MKGRYTIFFFSSCTSEIIGEIWAERNMRGVEVNKKMKMKVSQKEKEKEKGKGNGNGKVKERRRV